MSRRPTYHSLVHRLLPDVEYHQNRFAREITANLTPGGVWLDLGAGKRLHGGWVGESQERLRARAGAVIGCDVAPDGLRANRLLSGAALTDGARLPFGGSSFDLVTANMVLEHLEDPLTVFREVRRVLKPGGSFVFVTPNLGHPVVRSLSLVPRVVRQRVALALEGRASCDVFPTFYRANTPDTIRGLARLSGLEVGRVELFSSYPMVRGFLPVTWLECWSIRLAGAPALAGFRSNIVGCLRRPG